ncbi:helicase [Invertebrate iridescent virus 30]|uniref:ATP-dependent DNA helicase PIF1 n=1 Tax=Invertebrate iridescent virus 30 TaxID=345585 RepID=W8W2J2_9VIRU|nr:helicase [Invertebrate iridescent virus 30]CCV02300.1 ATP-dependent DNA helicase PIF1 [Invertebrate iridescent virus 30]
MTTEDITKYAASLPLELKVEILKYLDYTQIKWITNSYFWIKYWEQYNQNNPITDKFIPNPEQQYTLRLIEEGKNIFINAPAGTGKSALIKYFWQQNFNKKVLGLTSTTGISALNIGGSTLHSFLGIGLGKENVDDLYDKIIKNREKHELWLKLDLLIIDEISMLHPELFNKLEKVARLVRENKKKFGGIQLIVTGDLFQLPPVSQDSTLIINSSKFNKCIDTIVEFRNIIRQVDPIFKNILNKIRIGIVDTQVKKLLKKRFIKAPKQPNIQIKPTKLYCTRKSVDHLNENELNKLANKGYTFREYIMEFINQNCPISFDYIIKNFVKNSTTPSTLQICEQTQVMLTYNISPTLVNGSRGIVTGFTPENYPLVTFINGETVIVRPIKFSLHCTLRCGKVKLVGYAVQVPLKIAYALTIHACQGSTLDYASINLRETFEYGQAYTALSRVRTLDGLFLKKFNFDVIQAHPKALKFLNKQN